MSYAERPPNVSQEVWDDFQLLRKEKKAPLTTTALKRLAIQATRAGLPLEEALAICCEQGWQGFKAAWLPNIQPVAQNGLKTSVQNILNDLRVEGE